MSDTWKIMQICISVNLFQGVGFKPGGDMHAPYIEVVLCPLLFVEYNAVGYNSLFCEVKVKSSSYSLKILLLLEMLVVIVKYMLQCSWYIAAFDRVLPKSMQFVGNVTWQ